MKTAIDRNTAAIGRFGSARHAKRYCRAQFGKLPRCGYEVRIARGYHRVARCGRVREYSTYLQNNSGRMRVWTFIESWPEQA